MRLRRRHLAVRKAVELVENVAQFGVGALEVQPELGKPAVEPARPLLQPRLHRSHAGVQLGVLGHGPLACLALELGQSSPDVLVRGWGRFSHGRLLHRGGALVERKPCLGLISRGHLF